MYHMAEDGSLGGILRYGLLSTSALLDLFEVRGERREAIESARRPESVVLKHPEHGRAVVRDNKPLGEKALARCLTDISPREWYRTLNGRVFFWTEEARLVKLLGARAYRERAHLVLVVDTASLLARHAQSVSLSTINSGATFPLGAPPRGSGTFRPLREFPLARPVVELTVDYAVPDVRDFILSVSRWRGGEKVGDVRWSGAR
ncbi:DUF7002 family protein [Rubrobacter radiotolerans]